MKRRSYRQHCGIASALDVVGDRWTLLIVRELLYLGPRRFADLARSQPGLAPNLLTRRLRELEHAGILTRSALPPPASATVYQLTARGRQLEPVLRALLRFGTPLLGDPRDLEELRTELPLQALRAVFRPEDAEGVDEVYEFRIDDLVMQARVVDGTMTLRHGAPDPPDVIVTGDALTLADIAAARVDALDALGSGSLRLEGEPDALRHFVRIFAQNPDLRPAPA